MWTGRNAVDYVLVFRITDGVRHSAYPPTIDAVYVT